MPIDAQTEAVGSDNPTLAFNLAPVNDWSTALPFIDLAHMMRSWIGHMPGRWGGWGEAELRAGGYLDADGWLVRMPPELASVGSFFEAQFASAGRRGTFVMTYEGEGTIQLNNVRVISQTPGRITFESATGDGFWFNITATDPSRTGNYIRDISIVHQDNLALHEAGAVFNPDWLALIADARQIRFMDWMETNNSTQSSWANRPHEDKYTWAGGVPVEVMVQLANEIGADPWFNMPHLATDDYIRQFATYVRDHLDPNLTARVEWSNEMWNGAFAHSQILLQGSRAAWGVDAPHDYHAMKATQTALIWEEVFAQATGPVADLVNVLGSHTHNPWISGRLLDPSVWRQRDPGGYTPPADVFEELAIASYFGTAVVSNTNYRTELLNRINQSPADATAWLAQRLMDPAFETSIPYDQNFWRQNADIAHQYGLGLVAYEGGQHVHHSFAVGGLTEAQVTQLTTFMSNFIRSPQMGTLYQNLWDAWAAVGDGPMMQFQEAGAASRWGSWGLLSHLDDSTPRSQALFDRARTATPWWETAANAAYQHGVNTTGTALADTLTGTAQEDYLAGQDGNDTLIGGAGADGLSGGRGVDILSGGTGADRILGGDDDDTLRGEAGIDTLTGGAGRDAFSDTASGLSGDTITDLSYLDRIVITDANFATFSFSLSGNTLTYTGGSLTLATVPAGRIVAVAAAGGGVQLTMSDVMLITPPGGFRQGIIAEDFNGDGRDDILWRNDSGQVANWLGQANGGFASASTTNVAPSWKIVATGDFNGDGRKDILWREDFGQLATWLGQSNGSFASIPGSSVSTDWTIIGTGDFNGDGRDDILWRSSKGEVTDWLGTTSGGFEGNSANAMYQVPPGWTVAGAGDFHGDGREDIFWRSDSGQVANWLGQANGAFVSVVGANVASDWHVATIGDFNGDGREDILLRSNSGQVVNRLGQANGTFVANSINIARADWHILGTGDFNGDGRGDILWRHNTGGQVENWLGQTNGSFTWNAAANPGVDWRVGSIGDFNNDGRDDVVWRNDSGAITDWLGQTNGSFTDNAGNAYTQVATSWTLSGGAMQYGVTEHDARNDFNGDGRSDVLFRNASGQVANWLGQANGGLVSVFGGTVDTDWQIVGSGDFNGDGRDDLLLRHSSGNITDWLGQANGTLTSNFQNVNSAVSASWNVAGTGDFNGDGRDDVLWRHDSGQVANWLGLSNGGFLSNASASAGTDWTIAGTGDFNGDGRADVLWRHVGGAVTNWLGQADGSFVGNSANAYYQAPAGWTIVGTGDFNGDGRDDVLWRSGSGQVATWLGQANGGLLSTATANPGSSWGVASIGDYNGDGRDDILLRNSSGDIGTWLGQTDGSFVTNFSNSLAQLAVSWHLQPSADTL